VSSTAHLLLYILGCILAAWLHLTCRISCTTTARILKFVETIINVANTPSSLLNSSLPIISGHSNHSFSLPHCQWANSWARIKPTALLSVFDKENSIEFLLDLLHYIYNYYVAMLLVSHGLYVTHQLTSLLHIITVTYDSMWHDHSVTVVTHFVTLWLVT